MLTVSGRVGGLARVVDALDSVAERSPPSPSPSPSPLQDLPEWLSLGTSTTAAPGTHFVWQDLPEWLTLGTEFTDERGRTYPRG